ncbi:serine protease inhibitor [Arthrobacter sp. G119Y2]|uniref:serine protease inhibitor n=1 Tax=Arthrobacter sp. G119Y2 TaxID=3134965 RepID=UPI00311A02EC
MFRPLRSLLIPLATVLVLAGCGGSPGSGTSESSPEPSSTATASTEPSSTAPSSPTPSSPASSGPAAAPSSPAATSLTVEFRAEGADVTDTYSLECDGGAPVGSSAAPDPVAACAALAAQGAEVFAPLDPNLMCTQMIKGPQRAHVSGTLDGAAVDREFLLANGCEIPRWESLTGLLGPAEATL